MEEDRMEVQDVNETGEPDAQEADAGTLAEVEGFVERFPGVTELPEEVHSAWLAGKPLADAYSDWRAEELERRQEAQVRESRILRQNLANFQRAPVAGVSRAAVRPQAEDAFLKGLDEDDW